MKYRVQNRFNGLFDYGLRNAIRYGRDGGFIMHLPL